MRAGAHEDINLITLLLGAEEAGLELLDRDGKWLASAIHGDPTAGTGILCNPNPNAGSAINGDAGGGADPDR